MSKSFAQAKPTDYKYVKNVGSGGFGIVDEVQSPDGVIFAMKTFSLKNQPHTLSKDLIENVKKRFRREAIYQSETRHKNIVPVFDKQLGIDPPYFIMPLAICSLEAEFAKDVTIGGNFLNVLMDIIAGLEEIHKRGIFHRDLKPGNVLKFSDAATKEIFYAITDFGLMSKNEVGVTTLTNTEMQKGADYYTAPEVANGLKNATAQSDIFSLGCILHDMVGKGTTRVPFQEINIPGAFSSILHKCTKLDPRKRFKSVVSLRDALITVGTGLNVNSTEGGDFVKLLEASSNLTKENWESLIIFIDEHKTEDDGRLLLRMLTEDHITSICQNFPDLGKQLASLYAEYVGERSFIFGVTDGLASRLELFIQFNPIEIQTECLLAMLYLGTRHNRFYVEHKFYSYIGINMDENLARRMSLEFLVEEEDVCNAITHLEYSISISRKNFHKILVETLNRICG
jgi:serine/threonine protein kinase